MALGNRRLCGYLARSHVLATQRIRAFLIQKSARVRKRSPARRLTSQAGRRISMGASDRCSRE
eukprot:1257149-Prymnesium_polylepis.1